MTGRAQRLADMPLKLRVRAARRVIAAEASLDEEARKVVLALALWPEGDGPTYEVAHDQAGYLEQRKCRGCGEVFHTSERRQAYCDEDCRSRAHNARRHLR